MTGSDVTAEELRAQGWAPGGYLIDCHDEGHVRAPDDNLLTHMGDKRCSHCHACATKRALQTRLALPLPAEPPAMLAVEVLRAVEWAAEISLAEGGYEEACPYCGGAKSARHNEGCALQAAVSQN